jgi:lysozyme family protein
MFQQIINFVLKEEGGYVNHPNDPGGETNFGISKRSYPKEDIKGMTKERAIEIYKADYWKPEWEKLGFPMAACMLDTAVNMGPGRAKQFFDRSNGDYVVFLQHRLAWYKMLVEKKPSFKVFERGWMNRVTRLRRFIEVEKGA